MKIRKAQVSGLYNIDGIENEFSGVIEFEERQYGIAYSWHLKSIVDGAHIGSVSRLVPIQIIPHDTDKFEYSLKHALEGLRKFRINRMKVYSIQDHRWINE